MKNNKKGRFFRPFFNFVKKFKMGNKEIVFKIGDLVKVSPDLTLLKEWIIGKVIKIRENPFMGTEIAVEDDKGRIFFGEKMFFKIEK